MMTGTMDVYRYGEAEDTHSWVPGYVRACVRAGLDCLMVVFVGVACVVPSQKIPGPRKLTVRSAGRA